MEVEPVILVGMLYGRGDEPSYKNLKRGKQIQTMRVSVDFGGDF